MDYNNVALRLSQWTGNVIFKNGKKLEVKKKQVMFPLKKMTQDIPWWKIIGLLKKMDN